MNELRKKELLAAGQIDPARFEEIVALVVEYRLQYKREERKKEQEARVQLMKAGKPYHEMLIADCLRNLDRDQESKREVLAKLNVSVEAYEAELVSKRQSSDGQPRAEIDAHCKLMKKLAAECAKNINTQRAKRVLGRYKELKFDCGSALSVAGVFTQELPTALQERKYSRIRTMSALDHLYSTDKLTEIDLEVYRTHVKNVEGGDETSKSETIKEY